MTNAGIILPRLSYFSSLQDRPGILFKKRFYFPQSPNMVIMRKPILLCHSFSKFINNCRGAPCFLFLSKSLSVQGALQQVRNSL